MTTLLEQCATARMPLRYGSAACALELTDSRYTQQIVALRNNPEVNRFIHHDHLTEDMHERWLAAQMQCGDSLDFVVLVHGAFAGTASLYQILPGESCEFGRMVMCSDPRRMYAIAVEFLCLSFAFEILRVAEVYCTVVRGNEAALNFHLRNGWRTDERYDRMVRVNGSSVLATGLSLAASEWPTVLDQAKPILQKLHSNRPGAREWR